MKMLVACAATALLAAGCGGEVQKAEMPLYQAPAPAVRLAPVQGAAYSDTVPVGPEGKKAAVRVRWTVGRDSANCLRIASLSVDRVGGDTGVRISDVGHVSKGCGTRPQSADTTRYETTGVTVVYNARSGLRRSKYSGPIAYVTGTGELVEY
ncbi:MAG: hypothetical protein ABW277_10505 [Longimicrobiaceae bacterium]